MPQLKDSETNITIDLDYDGDGFPIVKIDLGGNYYNEDFRPTIQVIVDGVEVHSMFDHKGNDLRWNPTDLPNEIELNNGGAMEWDGDDGTIRYIDADGNCADKWEPGDEGYDSKKATYFPQHQVPEEN